MKISELTDEQLTLLTDICPEWVARNRPEWMVRMELSDLTDKHLNLIASNRPCWMADNRPYWMARNYTALMCYIRPYWMAKHRTYWMAKYRPHWVEDTLPECILRDWYSESDKEVPDKILNLIEEIK